MKFPTTPCESEEKDRERKKGWMDGWREEVRRWEKMCWSKGRIKGRKTKRKNDRRFEITQMVTNDL